MAAGLTGFAQGLTGGFQQGFNMTLAADKNKREQELFDLQKTKIESENEEIKRKNNFRKQIAEGLAAVEETISGGVIGGEAEDEFGQSVGQVEYASPKEAKASGLKFKEGTAIQKAPEKLTQNQIDRLRAEVFQKARIDNQLMDEDAFEKQRLINKTLKKEGFKEAYEYFEETNDSEGAIDIYRKNGKNNKVPDGAFMKRDVDPDTGFETIVVYAPGQDGKPQKITSSFDFHLSNMPEELIKYGMGLKKENFTQGQENLRLGAKLSSDENIAAGKNRIETAKLNQEGTKALNDVMKNRFSGIFRNPIDNAEAARQKTIEAAIGQRAEQYLATGKVGVQEAVNRAQADVFRDYKVDTSELAPKKK